MHSLQSTQDLCEKAERKTKRRANSEKERDLTEIREVSRFKIEYMRQVVAENYREPNNKQSED